MIQLTEKQKEELRKQYGNMTWKEFWAFFNVKKTSQKKKV